MQKFEFKQNKGFKIRTITDYIIVYFIYNGYNPYANGDY